MLRHAHRHAFNFKYLPRICISFWVQCSDRLLSGFVSIIKDIASFEIFCHVNEKSQKSDEI